MSHAGDPAAVPVAALTLFLAVLVAQRVGELVLSARNARQLLARGAREHGREHYPLLVLLHALFPLALVAEVLALDARPGGLAPLWLAPWLAAQGLRYAAMRALGEQWNTRVLVLPGAPLVRRGPYRWLRHPNYLAVVIEFIAAPLMFGAWRTALAFSLANLLALRVRIRCEERALAGTDAPARMLSLPRPSVNLAGMITFEQVSKRYGERLALDSVSWHMNEGECVVFLGPSGAGKTTILRLITHETQPTLGSVTVGTFTGGRLPRAHRALLRRTLGIVYEDFRLLHDRTVFENVALPVRVAGRFADEEVIPRVLFALEEVGLQLKQGSFPAELSAGEKQKAAIARAIVNRPAVILADEPTGALEKKSAEEVLLLLKRIHAEGAALLLVTTRHEVADALPARVLQLDDGRLVGGDAGMPQAPAAPGGAPGAIDRRGAVGGAPGAREAEAASGGSPGAIDEWGESEATGTREERTPGLPPEVAGPPGAPPGAARRTEP